MKISLHSVSYSGTVTPDQAMLSLEAFMAKAKDLGFDGVTLAAKRPHALPLDLSEEDRASTRTFADSLGLEIVCIAGYNDFADPAPFNRQLNLSYVIDCVKLARDLGAPIVRTFASGMGGYHAAPLGQQIKWVVEMAKQATEVAEKLGVTLVIQNHSPIGNNIHNLAQIVREVNSPAYRTAIDCPLLTDSAVDYDGALRTCADIFAFTTACDYQRAPGPVHRLPGGSVLTQVWEGVCLGQGECDWHRFLESLKEIGYDYWINYEMCSRMRGGGSEENLDHIASASLRYLRRLLKEICSSE